MYFGKCSARALVSCRPHPEYPRALRSRPNHPSSFNPSSIQRETFALATQSVPLATLPQPSRRTRHGRQTPRKAKHHSRRARLASSLYVEKTLAQQPKDTGSDGRTMAVTDAGHTARSARASRPPSPLPRQLGRYRGLTSKRPFSGPTFHQR